MLSAAVAQARRQFPRPTNAEALALLEAFGQPPLDGDAYQVYQSDDGVMPRFRLTAAGWVNPGDVLRTAPDELWWRRPYLYSSRLYAALAAQAHSSEQYMAATGTSVAPVFDADLARGDESALAHELVGVKAALANIYASGTQSSPPWLWTSSGIPMPNPKDVHKKYCKEHPDSMFCNPKKTPLPRIPRPTVPWWVLVGVVYLLTKER